jgi:hypothetical protein
VLIYTYLIVTAYKCDSYKYEQFSGNWKNLRMSKKSSTFALAFEKTVGIFRVQITRNFLTPKAKKQRNK